MSKSNLALSTLLCYADTGVFRLNDINHDTKPIIVQQQDEKERALAQANAKRERKRLRNALLNLGK